MQTELTIQHRLRSVTEDCLTLPDERKDAAIGELTALVWVLDRNLGWAAARRKAIELWTEVRSHATVNPTPTI